MTGRFVVLVGPDGVGKTTVAARLIEEHAGPTRYFHFRAPVFGDLAAGPDFDAAPVQKTRHHGWPPTGWIRLANSIAQAWAAHAATVRPQLRRGCLVVADRWVYGYVGQPTSLRFYGPRWLASLAIRLLPTPDLVVNLSASPHVVAGRKRELTVEEASSEMARWRSLPVHTLLTVSNESDPSEAIAEIRKALG